MGAVSNIFTAIVNIVKTVAKFLGTTAFKIGGIAVTWGNVGKAIIYGGVALSSALQKKSGDFGSLSPTYQGSIQTQTNQDLPIPLLYGTCKLAGNRIWKDENYISNIKRIVAFAEGEICEYSDIRLNDIPINELAGITGFTSPSHLCMVFKRKFGLSPLEYKLRERKDPKVDNLKQ